ncbi:MAG: protein kinase [Anaerolineae bacterium]|nr:protein kinase [Anaerolineae bacterium]
MPEICPKCGAANPPERHTCRLCGEELGTVSFAEMFGSDMFGPPRQLKGQYTIQGPLSQRTHVSLYRAIDQKTNRTCFVHQASLTMPDMDLREALEQHFLQEAAAWKVRSHPNILPILDADVQNHRLYLITAPFKGTSLRSIIQNRNQVIPEQTLLRWAEQMCDVFEYLHNQDPPLVLGCLSPSIIHVDESGHIQLIEVGLVRYSYSGLLGPTRGVPGYAAPEQRTGTATPQSDLYALGIVLYQLITRFDPKERPLPPLEKYGAGFSDRAIEAIAKSYRREPAKRYASAAEMRDALLAASPSKTIRLQPFELIEGKPIRTIPDIVQACATNWDEGLLALINGRIVDWLARAAGELRSAGQDIQAEQIASTAERTLRAQEQMTHNVRPGLEDIAHNAAFASWLKDLGAASIQPGLEVKPPHFDFGVVAPTIKAKSTIQIRNKGRGYLTGRVESKLPWITVPQPVFGCRAGETTQVSIEMRGRNLPPGDVKSLQAIRVTSNGGDSWIQAQATSSPPVLDVQPRTLDYGPITRGASRIAHLVLSNKGGGRLNGHVTTKAPWLRIRRPQFSCTSGASARIAIELLSAKLPKGAVRIRRALAVDSDSGQAQIDIAWKWARPALELDTLGLDFESIERGVRIKRTITLANRGTADLIGTAESQVPWLDVQPTAFQCPPGTSQRIEIQCDSSQLPGGSTVEAEAIYIAANAGSQTLSASVEVLAPELAIETTRLDLGTVIDGEQAEETIMIGNHGSLPWQGELEPTVDWLVVDPQHITCEPGHSIPVTVMVNPEALTHGGEWNEVAAIQVRETGPRRGADHAIAARLFLSRPRLAIERHSIDFGLIGRTDVAQLPLEITNNGTGELNWQIETRGTWIEALPTTGVCGTGETSTIQINAYALAVSGESGQAWLTVRSNGGRIDLPLRIGLSSPQLAVEPLALDLTSTNFEPSSQTLWIFNRGVGELNGIVVTQVPWLIAEPAEFECAAGMSAQIQVRAALEENAHQGTHYAPDALRVESNAGSREIEASLTLALTPRLHIKTRKLVLKGEQEQTLLLENSGYGSLHVRVTPQQDWISVNRRDWTIKAAKTARVQISLNGAPEDVQGSIEIHSGDEVIRIPVINDQTPAEAALSQDKGSVV